MGEIVVPVAFHILCQLIWADARQSGLAILMKYNLISNKVRNAQVQHSFSHALWVIPNQR